MRTSHLPLILAPALTLACNGKDSGDDGAGDVSVTSLGSHTTDTGGLTGPIDIVVPDDGTSNMIRCGTWGFNTLGTAWEIRDPDGGLYYANEVNENHARKPMRSGAMDDTLPVLFPVSPQADLKPGTYTLQVWVANGGTPSTFNCELVSRTGEVPGTAVVDLHFVFVGATGLDKASAKEDATFQEVIGNVDAIWSGAGLSVGAVTYADFGGNVDKFSVIDYDGSEAGELYQTISGDPGRMLTVFVVDSIESSDGSEILGAAAGPPGTATLGGNSKAGMMVAAVDYAEDPTYTAQIIAHEAGHFLGLNHTTEKDGSDTDPLADTPECSGDTNGDGILAPSECSGKDAGNLMFWAPNAGSSTDLSANQGWVLRRNPAVK